MLSREPTCPSGAGGEVALGQHGFWDPQTHPRPLYYLPHDSLFFFYKYVV